ncbi:hypothetical protein K8I61_15230 [bacterium]|nr:hypothetical protein [bacterium]
MTLASRLVIALVCLAALGALAPTYTCGDDDAFDGETDDGATPEIRCKNACDALSACGLAVPDDVTGVPLSTAQCKAGCDDEPGNVACVGDCVDDYELSGDCGGLEACVTDACGIPVG